MNIHTSKFALFHRRMCIFPSYVFNIRIQLKEHNEKTNHHIFKHNLIPDISCEYIQEGR